jgi:phosphatidylglycerol:prolipoprotein diacylglycerol transferase
MIAPMYAILFPNLNPVALSFGPLEIRWYGIAYVVGILLGWAYSKHLVRRFSSTIQLKDIDDFIVWATVGIVAGGRLGYALFYKPWEYLSSPFKLLYLWQPGMSFHGGLLGMIIVIVWFCRRRKLPLLVFGDVIASSAPIGLFFGRIANFINSELYGRMTDAPWGIIFPNGGPYPRHPSQLYEAVLEGVVLFLLMYGIEHFTKRRQTNPGFLFAVFLIGYAVARIIVEMFRQPDNHLGYFMGGLTLGQILSIPIILGGLALLYVSIVRQTNSK